MNKSVVLLLVMLVALSLGSCGNGNKQGTSGGSAPLFGKSDKEKADEFVKTLGKDAEVLLVLPSSAPKCVFYAEENIIKCHNVESDSTRIIPYGDIDEEYVSNVLAGKTNILVTTNDYDEIDRVFVYDVAKDRFFAITPCEGEMKITSTKLSMSNQSITFTCDTTAKAPRLAVMALFDSSMDYDSYMAKRKETGYCQLVKTYNFDGKLIKTKRIPISYDEWKEKEKAEREESEGYGASYIWRCDNCGDEMEGVSSPSTYGCPRSNGTGHWWRKMSRVR